MSDTVDPGTELATIESARRDTPALYWSENENGRAMRERELQLLDAGISGKPAPRAAPKAAVALDLDEIERLRREEPSKYWSDDVLRRERQLIAQRDGLAEVEGEESWRTPPEEARKTLPPEVVREWDADRDFNGSLKRVQDGMVRLVGVIRDEATAQDFLQSIGQFSEAAQAAIIREAGMAPSPVTPADADRLEDFKMLDGGAECIEAWGDSAARNVARCYQRFDRLIKSMPGAEARKFHHWFRKLISPTERCAVLFALGS